MQQLWNQRWQELKGASLLQSRQSNA